MKTTLEVCIDNANGLQTCIDAGVDRIELCAALDLGGLTPSAGSMYLAAQSGIAVSAMIRPRAGDFCFNDDEINVMCSDIAMAKSAGLTGVVIGIANQQNELNYPAMLQLCKAAEGMHITLHRVIDTLNNPLYAIEQAIDMGIHTILSSGGEPSVKDGITQLGEMQLIAAGKVTLMAGAGLTPELVPVIHRQTGITTFHSSCKSPSPTDPVAQQLGMASATAATTDAHVIKRYRRALKDLHMSNKQR